MPTEGLDDVELRSVVTVLSTAQITSWGVLYYAFTALQSAIATDTGWSQIAVAGAFSLAQLVSAGVGIWVGRRIDTSGPRVVMTVFSLVAVPGVALLALAPNLATFYLGWTVVGVAMAGTLYPPAFAALTRWAGERRVRALTTLTLVAGLASTLFAPTASALDDWLGWRNAYLVLMAGLALVTVPLHWWGLRHPWPAPAARDTSRNETPDGAESPARATAPAPRPGSVRATTRSGAFLALALANALTALAVFAVVVNLVPMLVEQGIDRNTAALALGLGGIGQVTGRLGYARLAGATTATTRGVIALGSVALATAALALAPNNAGVLIGLGMVLGLARGVYTLIQATAITDRWGPAAYGTLNGILTAPALAAAAAAPFTGAALAQLLGSYNNAFLVLAALAAAGAVLMTAATPRDRPPP